MAAKTICRFIEGGREGGEMYCFDNLDPEDFEKLIRDILREIYGDIHIERFGRGADGGSDLRFSCRSGRYVVQCKNYPRSGFNALRSTLKREESAKLCRLAFDSYLLATSVTLTPEKKRKLAAALDHQIDPENIWGLEEINDYISEYPQVEKRNYKLWFHSVTVLKSVLHQGYYARAALSAESLKRRLPCYERPDIYDRAFDVLERHNFLIIRGNPGMGKTTLARVLALGYIREGYEYLEIDSLQDYFNTVTAGEKQIYFFDDFLGSTKLAFYFDTKFADEFSYVLENQGTKLIVTSRDYIFNDAREFLGRSGGLFREECLVDLKRQSVEHNCSLLAKRLRFEGLEIETYAGYDKIPGIVRNKNFNPRIIDEAVLKRKAGEDILELISGMLKHPESIWRECVGSLDSNRLSALYLLLVCDRGMDVQEFLGRYDGYNRKRAAYRRYPVSEEGASQTLKVLLGMYIDHDREDRLNLVNPGLEDFLNQRMDESFEEEDYRILLEAVPTAEAVQNILSGTKANRKLEGWETLDGMMSAIMTAYFASIDKKNRRLGRLRWFGKLLAGGGKSPFFSVQKKNGVTYPAALKRMTQEVMLDILGGAGGDSDAERLLLNLIRFAGEGAAAGLLTENFIGRALPALYSEILKCLSSRDEYNNDESIYLYCLFCEKYPEFRSPGTDEKVKMLVEAKKDGEIYHLFLVDTFDPFEKIELIGSYLGVDMELTIEDFKAALEDYHAVLDECRDEVEETYCDKYFEEDQNLRSLFRRVYREAAMPDTRLT